MRERPRNVGQEILLGLRQLKRGKVGRVITLPPIADIRARTGHSLGACQLAQFSRAAWYRRTGCCCAGKAGG